MTPDGLRIPDPAEAERRLDRHCLRCAPWTAYQLRRLWRRWLAFSAGRPADEGLLDRASAWFAALSPSVQLMAKPMLRAAYGRTAFDWAELRRRPYRRNEARLLRSVLTPDARARLRASLADRPRERAIIECLWTLRRAEVCALRWEDCDLARGVVSVLRGKGGKASWTLLPAETRAARAAWHEAAGQPPVTAYVFPATKAGRPYRPHSLGRIITTILRDAGLWTRGAGAAHRFRRTFASSYWLAHPGDLEGLRRLLRHESVVITTMYIHMQPEELSRRLDAVAL